MTKRRIKSYIGIGMLMLVSIGLTISTLHSHHHLQWNHASDLADTGQCITSDETLCPITGYLFQVDVPDVSTGTTFFKVEEVIREVLHITSERSNIPGRGRSPPSLT